MKLKNIILVLSVFLFVQCNFLPIEKPSEETIRSLFDDPNGSMISYDSGDSLAVRPAIAVYIDGSESMRGFISMDSSYIGGTAYTNFLRSFDAYARGSAEYLEWYKFGNEIQRMRGCNDAIKQTWFYDQSHTKLGQLVQHLSELPYEALPKSILIITDGIQSTPEGEDFREVVGSMSAWLSKGFWLDIFMLRSEFIGAVFAESQGGVRLGVYSWNEYGRRPFYVYLMSPTEDCHKQVKARLHAIEGDSSLAQISLSAQKLFDITKLKFKVPANTVGGKPNGLGNFTASSNVQYLYWQDGNKLNSSGELRAIIQLAPVLGQEDFLLTSDGLTFTAEAIGLDDGDAISESSVSLIYGSSREKKRSSILICGFNFGRLDEDGWLVYRIKLYPGAGTVIPPRWVSETSTDSDTRIDFFSRTPYLRELIMSLMLNSTFSEQPLAVFYVAITGRKT